VKGANVGFDDRKLRTIAEIKKGAEILSERVTQATGGRANLRWSNLDRYEDVHMLTVTVGAAKQSMLVDSERLSDYPNGEAVIEGMVVDIIGWIKTQPS
jgi:hypothetical protein